MKVAILTEVINSHSGARAPIELAKALKKAGHEVLIFAYTAHADNKIIKSFSQTGVKVFTIYIHKSHKSNFFAKFLPNLKLANFLKTEKPDVVLLAAFLPSLLAAKIAKIPVVKIYMGTQFDAYLEKFLPGKVTIFDKVFNKVFNILIFFADFLSIHLSEYVIAISHYSASQVKNLYKRGVDDVIYLGGDHLLSLKQKKSYRNSLKLLSVSRITPYKGFHILLDAINSIHSTHPIHLTIAGSNVNSKYLRFLKKAALGKSKIVLDVSDKELAKLYQGCDLYISFDRYLFFGLPIVEAAFFAKPAIALDFAAAREVIEDQKTGFVVKNPIKLQYVVKSILSNPQKAVKMGLAAKIRAQKLFSWENTAKKYDKFFKQILK